MSLLATMNATWQQLIYVPPTRRSRGPCRSVASTHNGRRAAQQVCSRSMAKLGSGLQLSQAPVLQAPNDVIGKRIACFRFWHDEKRFRGSGDVSLAQHMLFAAGGIRTGGNFKRAPAQGPMGWQQPGRWDILWSTSDGNHKAACFVKPGQLISALPGMEAITKKRQLAITLHEAYGDSAWQLVPRTYSIPAQLLQWRQQLADDAAAAAVAAADHACEGRNTSTGSATDLGLGSCSGFWVLKTGAHLGQGLQIEPANKALSALLKHNRPFVLAANAAAKQSGIHNSAHSSVIDKDLRNDGDKYDSSSNSLTSYVKQTKSPADRPVICVQQYITNPLLIHGCKFSLRLWVLVIGPRPFRAYLYKDGLVLFSSEKYVADMEQVVSEQAVMPSHLTNHAQNQSADVWPLQRLYDVLGFQKSGELWDQLTDTAGRVVAAARRPVRAAARKLQLPDDCAFELLGLDFLLDGSERPWLLEVNASPSMAWQHDDPQTAGMMKQIKQKLLSDLFSLLRLQDRYPVSKEKQDWQPGLQQKQQAASHGQGEPQMPHLQQGAVMAGNQESVGRHHSLQSHDGIQQTRSQGLSVVQDSEPNQLLVRAASDRYFKSRPEVGKLVQEAAELLQGAVAASVSKQDVLESVWHMLEQLQQQPQPLAHTLQTEAVTQQAGKDLLLDNEEILMRLEGDWQSCECWQNLLDHMPADVAGDARQCDIEAAMHLYWRLRQDML